MVIRPNVLDRQFFKYQNEYEQKALDVLRSGWYVLGREVGSFESEFADYLGAKHCVGVASGLDALWLSVRILGIGEGDEVIAPANTYIASIMGITINGATPVLIEPDEYYNIDANAIEQCITPRTKAIMAVHLYGQACDMVRLREVCDKHGLMLIEDCAQSHGATWAGRMTNAYAHVSCFSFYPSKGLGCFGDGGAVVTDDARLAQLCKVYRNYGSEQRYHNMVVGTNSRLDELQAGLLRVKLSHLDELNAERERLALSYLRQIDNELIRLPRIREGASSVWHLFVVACDHRDALIDYLNARDIGTIIHYPIPPHLSEAYSCWGYGKGSFPITESFADSIVSLPLYNGMTEDEQRYVVDALNGFEV